MLSAFLESHLLVFRFYKIEKSCLNRAITYLYKNKIDILSLHVKNNKGIFKYQNEKRVNGSRGRRIAYYFTNPDRLPPPPNINVTIHDTWSSLEVPVVTTRQKSQFTDVIHFELPATSNRSKRIKLQINPEAKCWFGNGLNDESVEEVMVK